jgi:hypothetical protein
LFKATARGADTITNQAESTPIGHPTVFCKSTSKRFFGFLFGMVVLAGGVTLAAPTPTEAASCVRFSATHFEAPGNDNLASNLNGEWVRIHNYCSTTKSLSSWTIKDYNSLHTYKFATGVKIGAGSSITLYSGKGTNTATKRFWGRSYGAVWNNSAPEYAYLRNASGTLQSKRTEY